jgi:hypothetical protein
VSNPRDSGGTIADQRTLLKVGLKDRLLLSHAWSNSPATIGAASDLSNARKSTIL